MQEVAFFHRTAVQEVDITVLDPGDRVSFALTQDPERDRPRAVDVHVATHGELSPVEDAGATSVP